MNPVEPEPNYLWSVASKKICYGVAKMIVSFIMSSAISTELQIFGVNVDPVILQAGIISLLMAVMEWIHDWVKFKTGWNWL